MKGVTGSQNLYRDCAGQVCNHPDPNGANEDPVGYPPATGDYVEWEPWPVSAPTIPAERGQ